MHNFHKPCASAKHLILDQMLFLSLCLSVYEAMLTYIVRLFILDSRHPRYELAGIQDEIGDFEILKTIEEALHKVGVNLTDVVRTRMFVTDISKWEEIGKAHGEFFKDIQPVATMVEVKAHIDARLLVEIEAEAIVGDTI